MSDAIMKAVLRLDFSAPPADMTDFLLSSEGLADVIGERLEQAFKHGFTPEHDLAHAPADLPLAALTYLEDALSKLMGGKGLSGPIDGLSAEVPMSWPFRDLFRPADARANLVKAAAFLIAAIDRLDGAEPDAPPAPDPDQGGTYDEGSRPIGAIA